MRVRCINVDLNIASDDLEHRVATLLLSDRRRRSEPADCCCKIRAAESLLQVMLIHHLPTGTFIEKQLQALGAKGGGSPPMTWTAGVVTSHHGVNTKEDLGLRRCSPSEPAGIPPDRTSISRALQTGRRTVW